MAQKESSCSHNCDSCSSNCQSRDKNTQIGKEPTNAFSNVKKVIGIVSGKGGVGKSMVTSLLASMMQKRGQKAAVLDADITGPSIPKAFGISGKTFQTEEGIEPATSKGGIRIMSVNLLLDEETQPVVWRGPIIAGTVKQFWSDVAWGDIDVLFVDMPPGTGDVPLTVFQSLPVNGIVIVTSPQQLVSMIVEKAVHMAEMMDIPVLGMVENMSYYECPDCHEKHAIFGESHIEEFAQKCGIETVCRLPILPEMAKACDSGLVEEIENSYLQELGDIIENC